MRACRDRIFSGVGWRQLTGILPASAGLNSVVYSRRPPSLPHAPYLTLWLFRYWPHRRAAYGKGELPLARRKLIPGNPSAFRGEPPPRRDGFQAVRRGRPPPGDRDRWPCRREARYGAAALPFAARYLVKVALGRRSSSWSGARPDQAPLAEEESVAEIAADRAADRRQQHQIHTA